MKLPGPILLIDDDKDDQEILCDVLRSIGVAENIRLFNSCVDALAYLKITTEVPFLILCDVNLPAMDGLEFRRIIHQSDHLRKKSIPFVFLSTTAMKSQVNEAYDLTVQGFFLKQMSMDDMAKVMTRIMHYWLECIHPNAN